MQTDTDELNVVSNYIHESFEYCLNIDCYTFKKLLINAFITNMRSSEQGQEYLENAWLLTQTETDTESMRRLFGKK